MSTPAMDLTLTHVPDHLVSRRPSAEGEFPNSAGDLGRTLARVGHIVRSVGKRPQLEVLGRPGAVRKTPLITRLRVVGLALITWPVP